MCFIHSEYCSQHTRHSCSVAVLSCAAEQPLLSSSGWIAVSSPASADWSHQQQPIRTGALLLSLFSADAIAISCLIYIFICLSIFPYWSMTFHFQLAINTLKRKSWKYKKSRRMVHSRNASESHHERGTAACQVYRTKTDKNHHLLVSEIFFASVRNIFRGRQNMAALVAYKARGSCEGWRLQLIWNKSHVEISGLSDYTRSSPLRLPLTFISWSEICALPL